MEIFSTPLFEAGQCGYALFRIPGIVQTTTGALLAYCEARSSFSDWADIDIWMRRRPAGSADWDPPFQVSARHPDIPPNPVSAKIPDASGQTCGSPVMIAAPDAVHLVYCVENYHCFYRRSLDDGLTWSAPREITQAFEEIHHRHNRERYPWRVFATGPGHGLRLANGRLLFTAWLSDGTGEGAHRPSAVTTLYSDDHGDNWHTGDIVVNDGPLCTNPSESVAVEIAPTQEGLQSTVLLNIRTETPRNRRLITYSPDGISNWSEPFFHEDLFEPVCCAGMSAYGNMVLFSNPDSSREPAPGGVFWPRRNLTLRLSRDGGRTWPESYIVDPGAAGYSDLSASSEKGEDGVIYCLYEQGSLQGSNFAPSCLKLVCIRGLV